MGLMADKLAAARIEVSSPDGFIIGIFHPDQGLDIDFRADGYRRYSERLLSEQLSALVTKSWNAYLRYRDEAFTSVTGKPAVKAEPWKAERRRYRAEHDETVFEGMSAEGFVYMRNTGLKDWHVVIRDGAQSALGEKEFVTEVASAYRAMTRDREQKVVQLRRKHTRKDSSHAESRSHRR